MGSDVVVRFNGRTAQSLTVGEIEEIEELSGLGLRQIQAGELTGKAMRAIAFVIARRDDPALTWEDSYSLRLVAEDDEEEETSPLSRPAASVSRRRAG